MKKLFAFLIAGVIAVSTVGCSSSSTPKENPLKYVQENSYSLGFGDTVGVLTLSVDGVIENTSDDSYSNIEIVFDIFDDANTVIGNSVGKIAHLGPNSKGSFTTHGTYKGEVAMFKIASITGTPD